MLEREVDKRFLVDALRAVARPTLAPPAFFFVAAPLRFTVPRFAVVRFTALRFTVPRFAVVRFTAPRLAVVRFAVVRFEAPRLAVLRFAVVFFRDAVLFFAVLLFAVLRLAVLRLAVLRFAVVFFRDAVLFFAVLLFAVLRLAVLRLAVLRLAVVRLAVVRLAVVRFAAVVFFREVVLFFARLVLLFFAPARFKALEDFFAPPDLLRVVELLLAIRPPGRVADRCRLSCYTPPADTEATTRIGRSRSTRRLLVRSAQFYCASVGPRDV